MTPWINSRDEGREGDPVNVPNLKEVAAKKFMELPCDYRDEKTPDKWIPRDGRMVRLTGRHPYNSEPPVAELTKHNPENPFLIPGNLHIIRNHGTVPKLDWDTHQLSVEGLFVMNSMRVSCVKLSMDELTTQFPTTEFPMTISCCGNRRKEMNMIKQTIGFNWGSAACGTMVYKGVLLRDLLKSVGVDETTMDISTTHVEFIGSEDLGNKCGGPGPFPDEPWGEKVKYATSLPLAKVLDPSGEVMVAFMANGQRLHPDRGYRKYLQK
jgi:nitrate reductase (NAD(P)H)